MAMSEARFKQLAGGMTDAAMKVYACVPMVEFWSTQQVLSEMIRKGQTLGHSAVCGCLDSLVRAGIVKEVRGTFCREKLRAAPVKALADIKTITVPEPAPAAPTPQPAALPKEEPMSVSTKTPISVVDTLGHLAQRLNAMALRHKEEMLDLANLVSDAAIEVQAKLEHNDADLVKLRQLQALLKGM